MKKVIFKLFYKKYPIFLHVLVTTFLIGCSSITTNFAYEVPKETNKDPEIYFCPKDDCSKILENHIKNANTSVHCAFYDLDLRNIIKALANQSKILDVMLVIDNSNLKDQIKGEGIVSDSDYGLMHNKFCVIDKEKILTGSFNPTDNDNYKNNNNLVIIYSRLLSENYEDEFDELWSREFGEGTRVKYPAILLNDMKIENYFCPEDKCSSRIIDLIKNAKQSIYFMTFTFTSEDIADALIEKNDLDIKGIFDSGQASIKYSQFERLKEFGINVKKDTNKYKMHHKVFIIDNQTVVTGSFNPTLSADANNDENLLIIHESKIADKFLEEFENLWS